MRGKIMRQLFITTAALSVLAATSVASNAADVTARPAPYAPPPPVYAPPPFSWTGFYLGGNIGGAWARRDVTDTVLGVNFNPGNNNGVFIGGGQLGYNWQVGYAVLGIEADFDGAANNNNTGTVFIPRVGNIQVTSNNRWITTLAARFGVTNGPWLFYGKAGAATSLSISRLYVVQRIRGGLSGYSSSAGSPPSLRHSLRTRRRALSYLVSRWEA